LLFYSFTLLPDPRSGGNFFWETDQAEREATPVDKLSVVIAIGLAVMFLGERLSWRGGLAVALIVAGVLVLAFEPPGVAAK